MSNEATTRAGARDIVYTPSTAGIDDKRYRPDGARAFREDQAASATIEDLAALAASPHWEDRIRGEMLRQAIRVTLPDQFPCIYETADSPSHSGRANPQPHAWVVSADVDMLHQVLPLYQELWDAYTSRWGPRSRRTFAVGHLDGLSPSGVYRPGATVEDVIGSTMLTHTGMYRHAPEHLRQMHPSHEAWTASREAAAAKVAAAQTVAMAGSRG